MSSALNSVLGNVDIGSLMSTAISVAFPPAAIAMGVSNMVNQAVGDAVNSAVSQLVKGGGMPSFLQDPIRELIDNVMKDLKQENDPECEEAAHERFGSDVRDMREQMTQDIANWTPQNFSDEEGNVGGSKGGGSWLVALAKALGQISGRHAAKLQELSAKVDEASLAKDSITGTTEADKEAKSDAASKFTELQSELQGEAQAFTQLQSSFSNVLKTIGEGLTTMGRKG